MVKDQKKKKTTATAKETTTATVYTIEWSIENDASPEILLEYRILGI